MRTEEQVNNRAREIMLNLKERFIKDRITKRHLNCAHNCRCVQRRLDLRYCSLKTSVSNQNKNTIDRLFLCEDDEWARNCPDFANRLSLADAENEFNEIVKSPSRCGQMFPHLAALIWVLNDGAGRQQGKLDGFFSRVLRLVRPTS